MQRFSLLALINKLMISDKSAASQINVWTGRKEYYLRWYMDRKQNLFSSFEAATLLCDNIIQQEVKRKFGNESLFFERPFNKCMVIIDVTDRNDFFQWLFYMDSKAKILRTEELQIQFVEYVRRRFNGTILAAQFPVLRWHELFEDSTVADAVLDRVVNSSYRFEPKGDTKRKENCAQQ